MVDLKRELCNLNIKYTNKLKENISLNNRIKSMEYEYNTKLIKLNEIDRQYKQQTNKLIHDLKSQNKMLNDKLKQMESQCDIKSNEINTESSFNQYFLSHFDQFQDSTKIYLNNIISNECNNIDTLITLNENSLIKYVKVKDIHLKAFINQINIIQINRKKWFEYLNKLNSFCYHKILDKYGIYTFNEFYVKINSIAILNKVINNKIDSIKLYENTPKYIQNNVKSSHNTNSFYDWFYN